MFINIFQFVIEEDKDIMEEIFLLKKPTVLIFSMHKKIKK